MTRSLLTLAVRSALTARVRTLVALAVTLVATVLLLAGLSMSSVAAERAQVAGGRLAPPGSAAGAVGAGQLASSDSYYRGSPVFGARVAQVGGVAPPPGLTALPRSGELVVSPRMQTLLADPATTMSRRYPGTVVGVVGPAGLVGPDELVVWAGVDAAELGPDSTPVTGFGDAQVSASLPSELRPAQSLLVIGFLIPLAALLATAASVGGEQRDRRLAALRLLGCTRRQVVLAAAAESAAVGALGAVLGAVLFAVLRSPLAPLVPVNGGVFAGDVTVSWPVVGAVVVAVPALGAAAAVASLRSVAIDALGVLRRSPRRRLSRWRALPLLSGLALLVAGAAASRLGWSVDLRTAVVYLGVGLTLAGVLVAGGLVSATAAAVVERSAGSVSTQLGARQARTAAARLTRGSTGMAALVVVSGLLLSFFPLLSEATASAQRTAVEASNTGRLVVSLPGGATAPTADGDRNGLDAVAVLRQVRVADSNGRVGTILVGDCTQLRAVLGGALPTCEQGVALPMTDDPKSAPPQSPLQVLEPDSDTTGPALSAVGPAFTLTTGDGGSDYLAALSAAGGSDAVAFLPAGALPDTVTPQVQGSPGVLLAVPHPGDLEGARTTVLLATGASRVLTSGEQLAIAERTTRTFRGLTTVALGSGVLVAALSLLVAAVDNARDQRRAWTSLRVLGAPRRTWRRSRLVQSLLTTVPLLGTAAVAALLAAHDFVSLADTPPPLPITAMATALLLTAATTLAVLAVAGRLAATPSTVPDPTE